MAFSGFMLGLETEKLAVGCFTPFIMSAFIEDNSMKYIDVGLMNGKLRPLTNLEGRVGVMYVFRETEAVWNALCSFSLPDIFLKRTKLEVRTCIFRTVFKDL